MRRSSAGRRHTHPIAIDVPVGPPPGGTPDDLTTWTNSAVLETKVLPGSTNDHYPLVVDATRVINPVAKADSGSLRFVRSDGLRLGHYRTSSDRILIVGTFLGGKNTIRYYWGKSGATQPGTGFPTHAEMMAGYRLALIFEGSNPIDFSNSPAVFTKTGTPTFTAGLLGQAMQCAEGSYVETTASKVRGDARNNRSVFALTQLPSPTAQGRVVCWANWLNEQRAFQLWLSSIFELYVAQTGGAFIPWRMDGVNRSGWNAIGASWRAGVKEALMLLNDDAQSILPAFDAAAPGALHNSTDPYIVGGTKVPGAYHSGLIEAVFELVEPFRSLNHLLVWKDAWLTNDSFWGVADRTPNSIDVPDVTGAPLNSEISFARKEVTGISAGTPISVSGDGSPTYSVGSTFDNPANIKAKGSTPGTVSNGNWITAFHTSANANSALTESFVTVGTVTSPRRSTTVPATTGGGGGTTVPTGPADVTVTSKSALQTQFGSIQGGKILEIAAGDYKAQGRLDLLNRDFRGGPPLVIRASTIAYRGPLPSQGGLLVSGETAFQSGSGGAEFGSILLRNVHNVVIQNFRTYQGNVGTAGEKWYTIDAISCSNITFENCKFCGYRPGIITVDNVNYDYRSPDTWTPIYKAVDPWKMQGRALQLGVSGSCSNMAFKKCLFHYFGDIQFYNGNASGTLIEDCLFSDAKSDHIRNDGGQSGFTCRRVYFGRTWATQGSPGGGIAHSDMVQNTTKTQPGWDKHRFEFCIAGPLDNCYPHIQTFFYECDNYPQYPAGDGLHVSNCLLECRAPNTLYARPSKNTTVTLTTVLQNQFGGRPNSAKGRDLLWHSPGIYTNVTNQSGTLMSLGGNHISKTVYHAYSINTSKGDTITDSTQLLPGAYGSTLFDYPQYSSSLWRPVMWYNPDTGVLNINEIKRFSPKTSASIHPNQKGQHYGASALLQSLGALA